MTEQSVPAIPHLPARPKVLSYPGLRRAGGYLGIVLPFALVIGQWIVTGHFAFGSSISAYYYTGTRNILVGDLCAIAVFLISCKGYGWRDAVLGDLAGVCAIGVAFFPTTRGACETSLIGKLHGTFAALLFVALAIFCLKLFTRTVPGRMIKNTRKAARNTVYIVCGCIILACIVLSLLASYPHCNAIIGWTGALFCFESIAIIAFGVAWITKGEKILRDHMKPRAVTPDVSQIAP